MKTIYEKKITDQKMAEQAGKHFGESWYTDVIDNSSDGYYLDTDGNKKLLFRFKKSVIKPKFMDLAISTWKEFSKKKHANRGVAGGIPKGQENARSYTNTGQNEGQYISSNISGYYDRALREHRGLFPTQNVCRTTAFTLNNRDQWNEGLPFIQKISKYYSRWGGDYYQKQKQEYQKINTRLKIPKTVFTTLTTNYNWRTACHQDSGDFDKGLGNLVVCGSNFTGGYLGFPQFKVLIKIEPGDFLLMDVHQWHCNTPIVTKNDGFRLSFVLYIRSDMKKCKIHKHIKGGYEYISEQ